VWGRPLLRSEYRSRSGDLNDIAFAGNHRPVRGESQEVMEEGKGRGSCASDPPSFQLFRRRWRRTPSAASVLRWPPISIPKLTCAVRRGARIESERWALEGSPSARVPSIQVEASGFQGVGDRARAVSSLPQRQQLSPGPHHMGVGDVLSRRSKAWRRGHRGFWCRTTPRYKHLLSAGFLATSPRCATKRFAEAGRRPRIFQSAGP